MKLRTFAFGLLYSFIVYAYAHAQKSIPYSRPHISQLASDTQLTPEPKNIRLFDGLLSFVTEQRIFYRNYQRVYLLRDAEIMFDIDWTLWNRTRELYPQDPEPTTLNASRNNINDPMFEEYLTQNGLMNSNAALVLIDTGFEGSIVKHINGIRKKRGLKPLASQLVSSTYKGAASSRIASLAYLESKDHSSISGEDFLNLVDEQIEEIEGLPKNNASSDHFIKINNLVIAASREGVSKEEQREADFLRKQLVNYLSPGSKYQIVQNCSQLEGVLTSFVALLAPSSKIKLNKTLVSEVHDVISKKNFHWFWHDLREVATKGRRDLSQKKLSFVWKALPTKSRPKLFDLSKSQMHVVTSFEKTHIKPSHPELVSPTQRSSGSLINYLITQRELMEKNKAALKQSFADLQRLLNSKTTTVDNLGSFKIGKQIGQGVRSNVFALGEEFVLKAAHAPEDIPALAVEIELDLLMQTQLKSYGIKILPILFFAPDASYMIRKKLPKKFLGSNLVGNLTHKQRESLSQLFEASRQLANDHGVGLDLKPDNLAWVEDSWVIFDLGPRTKYGPYAYTLDLQDFDHFLELWDQDEPRRPSLRIATVEKNTINFFHFCNPRIFLGDLK